MKSVVVEASTVAKAIEIAWLKAEKPEEFFIRILQEHVSGFLGFGSQKAKIVLFFKNTHKSDSLFPIVLKQKEYASFFGNKNLKHPTELNVVDHELNKNIALGSHPKKKQHNNQQTNQQKAKQNNQSSDMSLRQSHNPIVNNKTLSVKPVQSSQNVVAGNKPQAQVVQGQSVKQIKIQNTTQSSSHVKSVQPERLTPLNLSENNKVAMKTELNSVQNINKQQCQIIFI